MDHLKLIEDKITFHEGELAKLRNAREVLLDLSGGAQAAAPAAKAKPAPKKKAKHKGNGAAKASDQADGGPTVRQRVTEALQRAEDPMTSADLIASLGLGGNKQPVYTALNSMKEAGQVIKDDQRRYSLTSAA